MLMDGTSVVFQNTKDALTINLEPIKQDSIVTTIKLTIDRPAMELSLIYPPSTSGSLAYSKPAKVSSSVAPFFMHTTEASLDDNDNTFWSLGRNDSVASTIIEKKIETQHDPKAQVWNKSGWLEVDLGVVKTVTKAHIQEFCRDDYSPVTSFGIYYEEKGVWQSAAKGKQYILETVNN